MKDLYFKVLQHKATIPASVGVASFAAGFTVGYFWRYRQEIRKEMAWTMPIEEVEEPTYDEELEQMTQTSFVLPHVEEEPEEPEEIKNIFENYDPEWDIDDELSSRSEDEPYILHVEEFMNDEEGFHQSTLTYYEGDNILTDEKDVPIYNHSQIVGELKFGHGSNDPNVVFVRNHKLKAEYEILRDTGYYEHEVLGIDIASEFTRRDLKHSSEPRFRWDS